jgi:hypothetical protein
MRVQVVDHVGMRMLQRLTLEVGMPWRKVRMFMRNYCWILGGPEMLREQEASERDRAQDEQGRDEARR